MITVGMNYQVLEGKGPLFESVFNKVLQVMNKMTGHTASRLYRDTNDAFAYLIISEWSDRAAFDTFVSSDRFKGVVDWGKEKVLAARPRHEIYETPPPATGGGAAPSGCPVKH